MTLRSMVLSTHFGKCALGFFSPIVIIVCSIGWLTYSSSQDHIASISRDGDGTWYRNYEIVDGLIQDQDIFWHGIGHSIEQARRADVIFLGNSKVLFALDWRMFAAFEQKHRVKMFNMGFAGIPSGAFARRIIRKWALHPQLWVINFDADQRGYKFSFFASELFGSQTLRDTMPERVIESNKAQGIVHVVGRNVRWRVKMLAGRFNAYSYRSASSGNWFIDEWPNYASEQNPPILTESESRG
jgi:hypothetical protein